MSNKVYTEDIRAAINLNKKMPIELVTNLFRFNDRQTNMVKNKSIAHSSSINCKSNRVKQNRQRGANIKVTPVMTSVAATLMYSGWTGKAVADVYGCDDTTLYKALAKYNGYKSNLLFG